VAENRSDNFVQLDFFALLPGFAGGRALLEQRGVEHFRQLAQLSAQRNEHERRTAARNGSATRLRRLYHEPRTRVYVELDELVRERIVPWWPHQKRKQHRKRPVFVRIEVAREQISDDVSWLSNRLLHDDTQEVRERAVAPNDIISLYDNDFRTIHTDYRCLSHTRHCSCPALLPARLS
jgi:hypothetical protein